MSLFMQDDMVATSCLVQPQSAADLMAVGDLAPERVLLGRVLVLDRVLLGQEPPPLRLENRAERKDLELWAVGESAVLTESSWVIAGRLRLRLILQPL